MTLTLSHILIVEDDMADQHRIELLLREEKIGNRLSFARNAKEALSVIEAEEIDLILTDICLEEGMNGLELCQLLRSKQHHTIPIICMSDVADAKAISDAKKAGISQILVKPFSFESLHYAIKRLDHFWLAIAQGAAELRRL